MSTPIVIIILAGIALAVLLYILFQRWSVSRQWFTRLQQLDILINSAHDAIILLDENFRIIFWNKGAEALYGYTDAEVLGKESFHLLP